MSERRSIGFGSGSASSRASGDGRTRALIDITRRRDSRVAIARQAWCHCPWLSHRVRRGLCGIAGAASSAPVCFLRPCCSARRVGAGEPRFFRIGTAATGGSFFEIGGVIASAISGPAEGAGLRPRRQLRRARAGRGGAGDAGLGREPAADQRRPDRIRASPRPISPAGPITASTLFADGGPLPRLRAIASLFPEAAHLVVRADSPIRSLADLGGQDACRSARPARARRPMPTVLLAAAGLWRRRRHPQIPAARAGRRGAEGRHDRRAFPDRRLSDPGDPRSGGGDADPAGPDRGRDRRCAEQGFQLLPSDR